MCCYCEQTPYLWCQMHPAWRWIWCCWEQTPYLTFGVRFTQHGDGSGAAGNRPLTFGVRFTQHGDVCGAGVKRPYLWCQFRPVWRWMRYCCEQNLTFSVGFAQHGDGCGVGVNRPLPLVSDSPSIEMDVVLL